MTREEKIKAKQERAYQRKGKRIEKDKEFIRKLRIQSDHYYNSSYRGISWARKYSTGKIFFCEMRYGDCEERDYCNGDC